MRRIAIFGASGHGKVVAEIAELCGWSEVMFYDDDPKKTNLESWPVNGNMKMLISDALSFDGCIVAIGNNQVRSEKIEQLFSKGISNLVSLVHPSAIVSPYSEIGIGSVIMARSVINSFSKIGVSSIINTGSIIEHDNLIEDYVHISPGVVLAGGVHIGKGSWIGIGSSIKQNLTIGKNVIIGAGSIILENVLDNTIAFGVPAKIQKNNA